MRGPRGIGFLYVSSSVLKRQSAKRSSSVMLYSSYLKDEVMQDPWLCPPTVDLYGATVNAPDHYQKEDSEISAGEFPNEIWWRASAKRFERWEKNPGLIIGLGAAIDYYVNDVGVIRAWERVKMIASLLRRRLRTGLE